MAFKKDNEPNIKAQTKMQKYTLITGHGPEIESSSKRYGRLSATLFDNPVMGLHEQ